MDFQFIAFPSVNDSLTQPALRTCVLITSTSSGFLRKMCAGGDVNRQIISSALAAVLTSLSLGADRPRNRADVEILQTE